MAVGARRRPAARLTDRGSAGTVVEGATVVAGAGAGGGPLDGGIRGERGLAVAPLTVPAPLAAAVRPAAGVGGAHHEGVQCGEVLAARAARVGTAGGHDGYGTGGPGILDRGLERRVAERRRGGGVVAHAQVDDPGPVRHDPADPGLDVGDR